MSDDSVQTSFVQVGLRDFLFYVLPGFVTLLGCLGWNGVVFQDLKTLGDVSSSVITLLLSYCLGQLIYAYSYPVRWLLGKIRPFRNLETDDSEHFQKLYMKAAEKYGSYFGVEIFRYRTFARFCSLMIIPIIIAWASVIWGRWALDVNMKLMITIVAVIGEINFVIRYYRYELRYRRSVTALAESNITKR